MDVSESPDMIEGFVYLMKDHIDVPDYVLEAVGSWLVSSTLGRFCKIMGVKGYMRPNILTVICGPPHRARKSTLIHFAQKVYTKATFEYFKTVLPGRKESEVWEMVEKTIIEHGSYEGLSDALEKVYVWPENTNEWEEPVIPDTFHLISPEIGQLLLRARTIEYESGLFTIISKLYSGESTKMSLSKKTGIKRFVRPYIYFTLLGGMQDPLMYLSEGMARQGLLRRIIWANIDVTREEIKKELIERYIPIYTERSSPLYNPWTDEDGKSRPPLVESFSKMLTERMKYLHNLCVNSQSPINIILDNDASEIVNEIDRNLSRKVVESPNDPVALYQQSYSELLIKLSALKAISRFELDIDSDVPILLVKGDDVKKSEDGLLKHVTDNITDVLENLGASRVKPVVIIDPYERVSRALRRGGAEGLLWGELQRKTNMDVNQLKEMLLRGIEVGEFICLQITTKTKPGLRFFHKSYEIDARSKYVTAKSLTYDQLKMYFEK